MSQHGLQQLCSGRYWHCPRGGKNKNGYCCSSTDIPGNTAVDLNRMLLTNGKLLMRWASLRTYRIRMICRTSRNRNRGNTIMILVYTLVSTGKKEKGRDETNRCRNWNQTRKEKTRKKKDTDKKSRMRIKQKNTLTGRLANGAGGCRTEKYGIRHEEEKGKWTKKAQWATTAHYMYPAPPLAELFPVSSPSERFVNSGIGNTGHVVCLVCDTTAVLRKRDAGASPAWIYYVKKGVVDTDCKTLRDTLVRINYFPVNLKLRLAFLVLAFLE